MSDLSAEEAKRKKAIYDQMSSRQQKRIQKIGFEKWDPFEAPKDPIDIRRDKTQRTTKMLFREFIQNRTSAEYSNAYAGGVLEICLGIINDDERYKGMYDFACWYQELLKREEEQK